MTWAKTSVRGMIGRLRPTSGPCECDTAEITSSNRVLEVLVDLAAQPAVVAQQHEAADQHGDPDGDESEDEREPAPQRAGAQRPGHRGGFLTALRPGHPVRRRYPTPRTVSIVCRPNGRSIFSRR